MAPWQTMLKPDDGGGLIVKGAPLLSGVGFYQHPPNPRPLESGAVVGLVFQEEALDVVYPVEDVILDE